MADQQLLSRRQILALFGAGTGMAIVGAQGQQTQPSADGNVLGGADNMPAPYKVGESTYKGPLSVRSEVPQEDGITFIQTDAGNNDQFALHHYNGGWGQQGLDVTSLDAEEANITRENIRETADPRPDAHVERRYQQHERVVNSSTPVGSRFMGRAKQIAPGDETGITNTSFEEIARLPLPWVDSPPNMVPVLQSWISVSSDDTGETATVAVTNQSRGTGGSEFNNFKTGTGTSTNHYYGEVYLNEYTQTTGQKYHTSNRWGEFDISVQAKVSGGSSGATVYKESLVALTWEVI